MTDNYGDFLQIAPHEKMIRAEELPSFILFLMQLGELNGGKVSELQRTKPQSFRIRNSLNADAARLAGPSPLHRARSDPRPLGAYLPCGNSRIGAPMSLRSTPYQTARNQSSHRRTTGHSLLAGGPL
jgi:hypothetical protein